MQIPDQHIALFLFDSRFEVYFHIENRKIEDCKIKYNYIRILKIKQSRMPSVC